MTRAPQLAPSWLPRRQRRRINSELYKLLHRDTCSICGSPHKHNSRTKSGLDAHGNVVVAGECCTGRVVVPFGMGQYVTRHYDFLSPRKSKSNAQPTNEQIDKAITAYQQVVAATDKQIDEIERRGGGVHTAGVVLRDTPWKRDDSAWFK